MPTTLASNLINLAAADVLDPGFVRWTQADWLAYLNAAQLDVFTFNTRCNTKVAQITLAAGAKQSLPADGTEFLELLGATKVSRRHMDAQLPGWSAMPASASVQHVINDPELPDVFWVYPPSTGAVQRDVLYAAKPADLTAAGQTITVPDYYANALLDGMVYRAYLRDSQVPGVAERAMMRRRAFVEFMTGKAQEDAGAQMRSRG